MVSFIGNNFNAKGVGLINLNRVLHYRSIIGNGSGILSGSLFNWNNVTFARASDEYYVVRPGSLVGPFGAAEPGIFTYQGRRYIQIQDEATNIVTENWDISDDGWLSARLNVSENAILAPNGQLVADRLTETEDAGADQHFLRFYPSLDGSSIYCWSTFFKSDGIEQILFYAPGGYTSAIYMWVDILTGVVRSTSGGVIDYGVIPFGDGWHLFWLTAESDTSGVILHRFFSGEGWSNNYQGDGVSSFYIWNPQLTIGNYPSSPIHTEATSVTRNKDVAYIASADVPAAMRGAFSFNWVPHFDSDNPPIDGDNILMTFQDSGASPKVRLLYDGSAGNLRVHHATHGYILTQAIEFSAHQSNPIKFTLDPSGQSVTVENADSGNGNHATSESFVTTEGDIHIGMDSDLSGVTPGGYSEFY